MKPMQMRKITPPIVSQRLRGPMKSKCTLVIKFFEMLVVNVRFNNLSLPMKYSYTKRVMNTAVKKEIQIPIIKVVAKPRIGPVPKLNKIIPVNKEVMLESKIALNAFL